MKDENLKDCPFCRGTAVLVMGAGSIPKAYCTKCGATVSWQGKTGADAKDEVARLWNERCEK